MSLQLKNIKEEHALETVLITDRKGFQIYNSGFAHSHHLHALKELSNYFFPELEDTIVGIQTHQHTIVVRDIEDGKMLATRQRKE